MNYDYKDKEKTTTELDLKNLIRKLAWIFLVISILWFVYSLWDYRIEEGVEYIGFGYHRFGALFTAIFSIALFSGSNTIK